MRTYAELMQHAQQVPMAMHKINRYRFAVHAGVL
jgi:hypothetical protein